MKSLLLLLHFISYSGLFAQNITVRGWVKDSANAPLAGANVSLIEINKDTARTTTDNNGQFSFSKRASRNFTLIIDAFSMTTFKKQYAFETESNIINIRNIVITPKNNALEDVTVTTNKAVYIREDTISYTADSFKVKPNAVVEDLLKKMPGLEVDRDGNLTAQGKSVTRVKVNGKDFFNGDLKAATRELPADIIDRVDIIDDYGDQAAFTGIKDGEPQKVLNLQIKKDKNNGFFGNISAGKGTNSRYAGSLSANSFSDNQQLSMIANLNNNNADLFNFSSPGLMGGGGGSGRNGMGGAAMGMMGAIGGGALQQAIGGSGGGQNGITDTKSIGLNFRDNLSPEATIYGSYQYTHKNSATINNTTQQNLFDKGSFSTYQNSLQNTIGDNHRLSVNVEYNVDSLNYIKVSPSLAYRLNDNSNNSGSRSIVEDVFLRTSANTDYRSNAKAPNLGGNILFNHKFRKRGRNFSINLSGSDVTTNQEDDNLNTTIYYDTSGIGRALKQFRYTDQDNVNGNHSIRLSYQEPISKTESLEFNYNYTRSVAANDKLVYNVDTSNSKRKLIDSLSNDYENIYYTTRVGINYRVNQKKYTYSIGMAVQPAVVNSVSKINAFRQHLINYLPSARFSYKFSRSRSFDINYSGRTSQPSYTQLQPITDNTDPLNITVGNPDLRPEFSNTLNLRYNNFDLAKGNVFFSNISLSVISDKIITNSISKRPGAQELRYLNDNGNYSMSGFYFFSKPFKNRRYTLSVNGIVNYNNIISYINSERNIGRNWVISQTVKGTINTNSWLELGVAGTYVLNSTKYTLSNSANTQVSNYILSSDAKIYLPSNFVFSYDVQKTINKGYTSDFTDPFIINGFIEKKLFKKQNGSIKIQAFDVLNQNASVSRSVSNNIITDTYTNRLGRYFMLTFSLRLSRFAGANVTGMQNGASFFGLKPR